MAETISERLWSISERLWSIRERLWSIRVQLWNPGVQLGSIRVQLGELSSELERAALDVEGLHGMGPVVPEPVWGDGAVAASGRHAVAAPSFTGHSKDLCARCGHERDRHGAYDGCGLSACLCMAWLEPTATWYARDTLAST